MSTESEEQFFLVASSVDQKLAQLFTESTEGFINSIQQLLDRIEIHFRRSESGKLIWAPDEYVNCNSISFSCLKTLYSLEIARALNPDLQIFDGTTLRRLCRAFEYLDWKQRPTIVEEKEFIDPAGAVGGVSIELEKLITFRSLKTQKSEWVPTDAQIQKVKDAIAGMKFKTTNLDAIRKAARMKKQRVSIILKMIGHNAD